LSTKEVEPPAVGEFLPVAAADGDLMLADADFGARHSLHAGQVHGEALVYPSLRWPVTVIEPSG